MSVFFISYRDGDRGEQAVMAGSPVGILGKPTSSLMQATLPPERLPAPSLSLCRDDESWIPLGSLPGPSFFALWSNSESLSTQFVMLYVNISHQLPFFVTKVFSPVFKIVFMACCAVFIIIE